MRQSNETDFKTLLLQRGTLVIYEIAEGMILQDKDVLVVEGPVDVLRRLSSRFL